MIFELAGVYTIVIFSLKGPGCDVVFVLFFFSER